MPDSSFYTLRNPKVPRATSAEISAELKIEIGKNPSYAKLANYLLSDRAKRGNSEPLHAMAKQAANDENFADYLESDLSPKSGSSVEAASRKHQEAKEIVRNIYTQLKASGVVSSFDADDIKGLTEVLGNNAPRAKIDKSSKAL